MAGSSETELAGRFGEREATARRWLPRERRPGHAAASTQASAPRLDGVGRGRPGGGAAKGGVSLRQRLRVLARQRGAGRVETLRDAVDVRAANRGAGLDDGEAVRREHERGGSCANARRATGRRCR